MSMRLTSLCAKWRQDTTGSDMGNLRLLIQVYNMDLNEGSERCAHILIYIYKLSINSQSSHRIANTVCCGEGVGAPRICPII